MGEMLTNCGLTTRLSYKCMLITGDSFLRVLIGIMLAGIVLAPLIPTVLGKSAIIFLVGSGICQTLKIDPESKESAAIMMICLFSVTAPSYGFLTGCAQIPLAVQLMQSVSPVKITWVEYMYHNLVPAIIYSIISFYSVLLVLKPQKIEGIRKIVQENYSKLGPITVSEKKAIVLLVIILILLVGESVHGINAAWCMILIAGLTFVPGIDLMDSKSFDKIGFSLLYFLAGAMSIGSVAASIGIATEMANVAVGFLSENQPLIHLLFSYLLSVTAVLFLTPTTGLAAMSVPLTEISLSIGADPRIMLYSFFFGSDMYFMPYQYGVVLLLVSFKRVALKYLMQTLFVKFLLSTLILLPLAFAYWHLLGLL